MLNNLGDFDKINTRMVIIMCILLMYNIKLSIRCPKVILLRILK